MFGSMNLGKLFGIDFYVHETFWLLPLIVFVQRAASGDTSEAAFDVAVLLAVFGCVALHEVGHALAAKWYGIGTRDITLYPMGGVARLERIPERPWHEIVVALAGPAVNVAIAAGILAGLVTGSYVAVDRWGSHDPSLIDVFLVQLLKANVALFLFNLIPAFPMDGGRVLRAVLSLGMSRVDATKAAVGVGSVLAIGGGLYGLLSGQFMLVLVAAVVFMLGQAELASVRVQHTWTRRRRRFEDVDADEYAEPAPTVSLFTGWRWDPVRRVWSEWRNGILVREIPVA
jgi:Zn-dependent protease